MFKIISLEVGRRGICVGYVKGGARFCMSSVEEFNTASKTQSRGSVKYLPGLKEGMCVVMALSAPHLPSSALFQPVVSVATYSNVKSFEGI